MKKTVSLILAVLLIASCAFAFASCGGKTEVITIAVPNDTTNEARALLLLEANGIIKLKEDAGITATIMDITENPKNIEFKEVEAAQLPNILQDVDYAVINSNYAISAGLNPMEQALTMEGSASAYSNILAVKEGEEETDKIKALVAALESKKVADYITETYAGAVVSVVEEPTDGFDKTVDYEALKGTEITVAASPAPHAEILALVKEILAEKGVELKVIEYTGKSNIGIDMNTGDIVEFAYDKENEKEIVVEKTLWYWNEIVERYYQIVFDKDDEIGVKYMDADEEAKLLKAIKESTAVEVSKAGFAASAAIDEDSAYASLDIYEVNGKAYGIYEEYKFGYFKNSTTKSCDCSGDPARATYVLSDVITTVNSDGVITSTTSGVKFEKIVEGECKHGTAWINPNFAANATEDGYADGYVIYSADQQTGEVKIVKYINDCEDEDTYVAYGSVKSYSVADEYVVIGGEKFTFDYDNLEGSELVYVKQNKSSYSALLRDLFNQYIKYVVVDGEIVHIEAAGQKNDRLFVVEKYAGISSDGYIVVDGYFTNEAADLVRVRVNTYDNNYTGDAVYHGCSSSYADALELG